MTLPPGVAARDFENALRQWERAVGKEWVFTSDADLDLYRESYSPFWHEPEDPVPRSAIAIPLVSPFPPRRGVGSRGPS